MDEHSLNEQVEKLARTLVGIPSVNPVLADDPSIAGEARLASFLEDLLARRGFQVHRHEAIRGRPNLVATYGPSAPRRRLLIEAHLDTQGVHGMTVDPFAAIVRDGRLYGRGACDMKGPMAAALVNLIPEVLDPLAAAGVQVQFIGAIGEETGNLGAIELTDAGVGGDEILVLEPTDLHTVHAHKGVLWFEIELIGRAAHGSNPEKGLSAIRAMGETLELLQRQTDAVTVVHPLLGRATVNTGIVRGGTSINIVPDRCVLEVDRRVLPGEDSDAILAALRAELAGLVAAGHLVEGRVRRIKESIPFATTAATALLQRLGAACEDHGVSALAEGVGWYSDAGPFSRTCREVAVFGPGSIVQAHTADEYIELAALHAGAHILRSFLARTASDVV
jgi:acetylornithine deacetylase